MMSIDNFWRNQIKMALESTYGNITESAKILNCSRITIYRKMKQFNIKPEFYRVRKAKALR